jgi:hypothetical protein
MQDEGNEGDETNALTSNHLDGNKEFEIEYVGMDESLIGANNRVRILFLFNLYSTLLNLSMSLSTLAPLLNLPMIKRSKEKMAKRTIVTMMMRMGMHSLRLIGKIRRKRSSCQRSRGSSSHA